MSYGLFKKSANIWISIIIKALTTDGAKSAMAAYIIKNSVIAAEIQYLFCHATKNIKRHICNRYEVR